MDVKNIIVRKRTLTPTSQDRRYKWETVFDVYDYEGKLVYKEYSQPQPSKAWAESYAKSIEKNGW